MMKIDCSVIRDLMPLVIDDAASPESVKLTEAHVAQCPSCAQTLKEWQADIPDEKLAQDQAEFELAAHRMHRRRRLRRLLAILLPVLAAVIVLVIGGLEIHRLRTEFVPKTPDAFNVKLVQIEGTDQVVMLFTGVDNTGHAVHYDRTEDGIRFLLQAQRSQLTLPGGQKGQECFMQYMGNCRLEDGHIIEDYRGIRTVTEVVLTDGETERVVYRDGDPIPVGSDELTAYYNGWKSLPYAPLDETEEEFQARRAEVEKLKEFIPEFQRD